LLVVIQLSYADLRKFKGKVSGRTSKPLWSVKEAKGFVRGFGKIQNRIHRLKTPILRKAFKDEKTERFYVDASRRVKIDLHLKDMPPEFKECKHVFSRLISDGNFVFRIELGFYVKILENEVISRVSLESLYEFLFASKLKISDRLGEKNRQLKLVSQLPLKDSIYILRDRIIKKTTLHEIPNNEKSIKLVDFISLAAYVDIGRNESKQTSAQLKIQEAPLFKNSHFDIYFWEQSIRSLPLSSWLVCENELGSAPTLRRVRLHILRLFSETLILEYVMSALTANLVSFSNGGIGEEECNIVIEGMLDRLTDTSHSLSNDLRASQVSRKVTSSALADIVENINSHHRVKFAKYAGRSKNQKQRLVDVAKVLQIVEKSKIQILIMTANPQDTLRLRIDKEQKAINEELSRSQNAKLFSIIPEYATEPKDILRKMLQYKPYIFHFSGHGNEKGNILLEGENSQSIEMKPKDLSGLLRNTGVKCVVLNACYSDLCADSILANASSVIGMQTEIQDEAAICFSTGFYMAIFQEKSIRDAYECAKALVQAEHPDQSDYIIFREAD